MPGSLLGEDVCCVETRSVVDNTVLNESVDVRGPTELSPTCVSLALAVGVGVGRRDLS